MEFKKLQTLYLLAKRYASLFRKAREHYQGSSYKDDKKSVIMPRVTKPQLWGVVDSITGLAEKFDTDNHPLVDTDNHPLVLAIRDQQRAIDILQFFVESGEGQEQDLSSIKDEFDLLIAQNTLLRRSVGQLIEACDLLTQALGDRDFLLGKIIHRRSSPHKNTFSGGSGNRDPDVSGRAQRGQQGDDDFLPAPEASLKTSSHLYNDLEEAKSRVNSFEFLCSDYTKIVILKNIAGN